MDTIIHLVNEGDLWRFRKGYLKEVTSKCGKKWAPTIFNEEEIDRLPKCQECFAVYKYSVSA